MMTQATGSSSRTVLPLNVSTMTMTQNDNRPHEGPQTPGRRQPQPYRWIAKAATLLVAAATVALLLLTADRLPTHAHDRPVRGRLLGSSSSSKGGGAPGEIGGAPLADFVVRKGDQLLLRDEPFRFISFNAPDLHVVEDETWHRITAWEQEDALETISRMGGQVVRIYGMSIVGGMNNGTYTHILGKGTYNEALFRDLDRLLEVAHRMNVRVIIPFIDHWEWWGGIPQFTKLYGGSPGRADFYRKEEVKAGFKHFVRFLLERKNTFTGRLYKDDPAILAWESGNELDYDENDSFLPSRAEMDGWMRELAAYIKAIDPNHLVMDGRLLRNRDVSTVSLQDPNIDLITDHFYPNTAYSFEDRMARMLSFTKGHKPFVIGEFGLVMPVTVDDLLKRAVKEPAVAGALLWSLRSHASAGGFYWHYEYDNYWAYHYPGFDSNSVWGEKEVMGIMETHAYGIRGLPVPNPTAPGRPELIEGSNAHSIAWRGAVGAQWYEIERQEVEATPSSPPSLPATGAAPSFLPAVATKQVEEEGEKGWVKLADKLYDSTNPYIPFKDVTAHPGKTYRYRIYAVNEAGRGVPSPSLAIATPLASARASSSTTGESSSNNTTTASLTHEHPHPLPPPKEQQVQQQAAQAQAHTQAEAAAAAAAAAVATPQLTTTQVQPVAVAAVEKKKKQEEGGM